MLATNNSADPAEGDSVPFNTRSVKGSLNSERAIISEMMNTTMLAIFLYREAARQKHRRKTQTQTISGNMTTPGKTLSFSSPSFFPLFLIAIIAT